MWVCGYRNVYNKLNVFAKQTVIGYWFAAAVNSLGSESSSGGVRVCSLRLQNVR